MLEMELISDKKAEVVLVHIREPRPMTLVAKEEPASSKAEVPAVQVASTALVMLSKMTPPPEMKPWPIETIPEVLADHVAPRALVRPSQITSHPEVMPLPMAPLDKLKPSVTAHNPEERP